MSFGFAAYGDDHQVIIDDVYPVLRLAWTGYAAADTEVAFPQPVTTAEPPYLFIRPSDYSVFLLCVSFRGGPGYWTGFRIQSCAGAGFNHGAGGRNYGGWNYMVALWDNTPSSERFGMRVWDGGGRLLFDAGHRTVELLYQGNNWGYAGNFNSGSWTYMQHSMAAPFSDPEVYLLANPFSTEGVPVAADGRYSRKVGFNPGYLLHVMQAGVNGHKVWLGQSFFTQVVLGKPTP